MVDVLTNTYAYCCHEQESIGKDDNENDEALLKQVNGTAPVPSSSFLGRLRFKAKRTDSLTCNYAGFRL